MHIQSKDLPVIHKQTRDMNSNREVLLAASPISLISLHFQSKDLPVIHKQTRDMNSNREVLSVCLSHKSALSIERFTGKPDALRVKFFV
jgi:hypothetical protein